MCTHQLTTEWEDSLLQFRTNPGLGKNDLSIFENNGDTELSLEDQFSILTSIPNHHKWNWSDQPNKIIHIKHAQKFSTSTTNYPGSPRNRIIQAFCDRPEYDNVIYDAVSNIIGVSVPVRYIKRIAKRPASKSCQRKKKKTLKEVLGYVTVSNV